MDADLDAALAVLDRQRFAERRGFWNRTDPLRAYRHRRSPGFDLGKRLGNSGR
jgi:hypothetical protein